MKPNTPEKLLYGKKILFFAPSFFGYEHVIRKKMEEMGATVFFYDVRSVRKAWERALLKISPKFFYLKTKKYFDAIIKENQNISFDYVFMIKCDMPTKEILLNLRRTFNKSIFCLYLWDSLGNIPGIEGKFKFFDRMFSFDRSDCKKYGFLKHRPLFYCKEFEKTGGVDTTFEYDLVFCGTIHSDRFKIIKEIRTQFSKMNLRFYMFGYLQSKFMFFFYKMFKREFWDVHINDFSTVKKSSLEIAAIEEKSKVILDIQHPKQTGLTMRTIEVLGLKKKMITTNGFVKTYDFYDPDNIFVIDRGNISLDPHFFRSEYKILNEEIYEKYSLETWIKDILLE